MKSIWKDEDAADYKDDLGLRVYTSRLLGRDPSLVLHGGGNTSVKIKKKNILGQEEDILYVKGSGWDLETIDVPGFSPVRMQHLIELAKLNSLSDPQMVNELKTHMTDASAPTPSVEAILHATLPFKFVDHTHADAIVTITNTAKGKERIQDIYGNSVVIIDYIMPGFDLARKCAKQFSLEAHSGTKGMILLKHGIFTFSDSAKDSYENMIELVDMAEQYLQKQKAWILTDHTDNAGMDSGITDFTVLAQLRKDISDALGAPALLKRNRSSKSLSFARNSDVNKISQQGPATPDHVIRTKPVPMLGRDVKHFAEQYADYFAKYEKTSSEKKTMLDQAPRVILDRELGLLSVGRTAKDTSIIQDIYDHTIDVILRAEKLGGFEALPMKDIFDMEYWDLEQAKLRKTGKPPMFTGEVVLITGAASGIGRATVNSMLERGAAVIAIDINEDVINNYKRPDYLGLKCDITDEEQVKNAIHLGVEHFGGIDMLVLNAGMFPGGMRISELSLEEWRKVLSVNLDANLIFLRETYPYLKLAPNHGRVIVMGSKNIAAPGPGAAAYSASKAALIQLARITALEWASDKIRIHALHPDAVFDTGIWTQEVLEARARHYGMTVDAYKKKNLLGTEITSHDVGELAAEMCGPLFSKSLTAQLPVDGGNDRVL